jgi:hypothetical protein
MIKNYEPRLIQSHTSQPVKRTDNDKIAQATIEEARMVLPGIQALFGFQLVAVFNQRFTDLSAVHQYLHYAALILTAVSAGIIMAPAAYHRIAERYTNSDRFIRLASQMVAAAMIPLMLAISGDVYLLGLMITSSVIVSAMIGLGLLALLVGLWFVFPLATASEEGSRE